MFLTTTADARFWKRGEPLLFLGAWCLSFPRPCMISEPSPEVLPYHWDDRSRLAGDVSYLDRCYEKFLAEMSARCNAVHGVGRSPRYWRILLGPWLFYFIDIYYDRYLSIRAVADSRKVTNTWIPRRRPDAERPRDAFDFNLAFISDAYNLHLYSDIIRRLRAFPFEEIDETAGVWTRPKRTSGPFLLRAARWLNDEAWDRFGRARRGPALVGSYFSSRDLIRLQLALGQCPLLDPAPLACGATAADEAVRQPLGVPAENEFEKMLNDAVPQEIPGVYLENYRSFRARALSRFPSHPDFIFTANSFIFDDGFKFWAAEQAEQGTPMIGTQHGGLFGNAAFFHEEKHQIEICDRYYTWGWTRPNDPRLAPFASQTLSRHVGRLSSDPTGDILWVSMGLPRWSYNLCSHPLGPQFLEYLEDQFSFYRFAAPEVRAKLILRLYRHEYGWNAAGRWRTRLPELRLASPDSPLVGQLRRARLCLCSYNATTYLETFAGDFPTLLFWRRTQWEVRSEAEPYFDALRSAGILHHTPEEAAAQINRIVDDPSAWWRQPDVRSAKEFFAERFGRTRADYISRWRDELRRLQAEFRRGDR